MQVCLKLRTLEIVYVFFCELISVAFLLQLSTVPQVLWTVIRGVKITNHLFVSKTACQILKVYRVE